MPSYTYTAYKNLYILRMRFVMWLLKTGREVKYPIFLNHKLESLCPKHCE